MLPKRKIRVGIIDSGMSPENAKLSNMTVEAITIETRKDGVSFLVNQCIDECGHGTACAGIISSISPDVEFYAAKVLDAKSQGYGSALVSALEWMFTKKVDLINLSLGTTNSKYLESMISVINLLNSQNTILVSAAFWKVVYPATIPSVISVADERLFRFVSKEHLQRLKIDFVVEIPGTTQRIKNYSKYVNYKNCLRSSFAAAYVTGLVGLIRKSFPNSTPLEVYRLLTFCTERRKFFDFQEDPFLIEILKTNSFSFDRLRYYKGFQEKAKSPTEIGLRS